jgi:hypothetical protein
MRKEELFCFNGLLFSRDFFGTCKGYGHRPQPATRASSGERRVVVVVVVLRGERGAGKNLKCSFLARA